MDRDTTSATSCGSESSVPRWQDAGAEPRYRTVFLSDLHLGSPDCRIDALTRLLDCLSCEHVVLNGDIIDFWKMRRAGAWHDAHLSAFRTILRLMQERGMKVTYVRGNHDDLTSLFAGLKLEGLQFVEQFVYHAASDAGDKRYLVLHGDVFDALMRRGGLPTWAADQAYNALLAVNRAYNWQRQLRGKAPFSIAGAIKKRVGSAMRFIEKFEQCMVRLAREQGCDGVICGHIHVPADAMINSVHYLNSGDWVENCTAIVESHDGVLRLASREELLGERKTLAGGSTHEAAEPARHAEAMLV